MEIVDVAKWILVVFIAAVIGHIAKTLTEGFIEKCKNKKTIVKTGKPESHGLSKEEAKLEKKRLKAEKKRLKKLEKSG